MDEQFRDTNWYKYVDTPMKDMAGEAVALLNYEKEKVARGEPVHKDYSFVVFPMAKAYEGFLKKMFLDLKLISPQQYRGEHFRIGKALNPNLPKRYRSGWVYGKLAANCQGEQLPLTLWETWKRARNKTFHYFPDQNYMINLQEAEQLIVDLDQAMEAAVGGCGLKPW